jgi:hypothetical protein
VIDPTEAHVPNQRSRAWTDVVVSVIVVLVVSIPTMAIEEDWHGRPMIDQQTHLWVIAACLVAVSFFVGGVIAAIRRPSAPARSATTVAVVAVAVLLIGALYRRVWLVHEPVPTAVLKLWCLGAVTAVVLSLAGALFARQMGSREKAPRFGRRSANHARRGQPRAVRGVPGPPGAP